METTRLNPNHLILRKVQPQDNTTLASLIVSVLQEFGCVGPGYASSDPEIRAMFSTYQSSDCSYWVVSDHASGRTYGGGGFSRLKGTTEAEAICELQKVYFDPALRGMGFGRKIVETCIAEASRLGFKTMYLETVQQMAEAVTLYQKFGFQALEQPLGNTGHTSCNVFMSRPLNRP